MRPVRPFGHDDPPVYGSTPAVPGPKAPTPPVVPAPQVAAPRGAASTQQKAPQAAQPQKGAPPAAASSGPKQADLAFMIGQMIMVGFSGFDLPDNNPLAESLRAGRAGGIILFDRSVRTGGPKNIESPAQLRMLTARLQRLAPRPLFIAVDQEGGRVQRLKPERGFEGGPAAAALGRGSPENTRLAARRMGLEMAALGINFDFAPVADLNRNPLSPAVGALQRSFGADPHQVATHALAFSDGLAQAGVASCLKHFPGHGSAGADSHAALPDITASWRQDELVPYREAVERKRPAAVMAGHLFHRGLDALYPASLSVRILAGLLRGKLGFAGVILTDDLQMGAVANAYSVEERVRLAVEAGADIVIFGNNCHAPDVTADEIHGILLRLVNRGVISKTRIALSYERISLLKRQFAGWK